MDTPDPRDPNRPPEGDEPREQQPAGDEPAAEGPQSPADEQTTQQQPQSPAPEQAPVRRLFRSRTDRVLAGVCGGLARYFDIDPIIVRSWPWSGLLLGGVTLVAYVAALILVPVEPGEGEPEPPRARRAACPPARWRWSWSSLFFAWPIVLGGGLAGRGHRVPAGVPGA